MTVDAAIENDIPVSLCGEMGSDILFSVLLTGLGIQTLSVAPPLVIPEIKKIIRSMELREARELARNALAMSSAADVEKLLLEYNRNLCPGLFP
jgi:phosphotransferase system enzyme I (PtsI)